MTYISGSPKSNQWNAEDAQRSAPDLSTWDWQAYRLMQEADALATQLEAKLKESCDLNHAGEDALIYFEDVKAAIKTALEEIGQ